MHDDMHHKCLSRVESEVEGFDFIFFGLELSLVR